MSGMFGGGSKPKPYIPPPMPKDNSAEVEAARRAELQRRSAMGRAATILSEQEDEVETSKKKLLGA